MIRRRGWICPVAGAVVACSVRSERRLAGGGGWGRGGEKIIPGMYKRINLQDSPLFETRSDAAAVAASSGH